MVRWCVVAFSVDSLVSSIYVQVLDLELSLRPLPSSKCGYVSSLDMCLVWVLGVVWAQKRLSCWRIYAKCV